MEAVRSQPQGVVSKESKDEINQQNTVTLLLLFEDEP
jgi:hypothetical protein